MYCVHGNPLRFQPEFLGSIPENAHPVCRLTESWPRHDKICDFRYISSVKLVVSRVKIVARHLEPRGLGISHNILRSIVKFFANMPI